MTLTNGTAGRKNKPRVVSIGYPKWAGEDYMRAFEAEFDLHASASSIDASLNSC